MGCERGCLTRWLVDHDIGKPQQQDFLQEVDCPSGRIRCGKDGVEFSPARPDCNPPCQCAWEIALKCPCAIEGLELDRDRDEAAQLCAADASAFTMLVPIDAGDVVCPNEGERYICEGNIIAACIGTRGEPVSMCTFGCTMSGDTLDDPRADITAAKTVLCKRSQ